MKRVLITGVTGYIGSQLARKLSTEHVVYGLVRQPLNKTYLSPELQSKITLLPYDNSGESVMAALETSRPDVVYHLAACYTAAHDIQTIPKLISSNLTFGAYLLEAMYAVGCQRLVYATTVTIHYTGFEYRPLTLYAATKQAFSDLAAYYTGSGRMSAAAVALSDTYGPCDQRPKVLNLIRQSILAGAPLNLTSGRQIYDAVYIDDVVRGFVQTAVSLERTDVAHQFFQLSAVEPKSLRNTVELMLQVNHLKFQADWGGRPDPDYIPEAPLHIFPEPPGWRALVTLEEGLRRFWEDTLLKQGENQFG